MHLLYVSCLFVGVLVPTIVTCTQCWTCENTKNAKECSDSGILKECRITEICSTEVRRNNNDITIWKGCKQREACENQRMQNWNRFPHTCNNYQETSHCWCCCDGNSCNKKEMCKVSSTQCPMPSLEMDHGHVTCSNSNRLGSLCTYTCNETGYHGLPLNKQDRLCLGNGKWSEKKPCCVRPCPPYVPLDIVGVFHFNSNESLNARYPAMAALSEGLVVGKDFVQSFFLQFNEKVYDVARGENLIIGPYQPSANNTVNTGNALRYVRNNILKDLHRGGGHSDLVVVGVEKQSDDDVTEAAAELKRNDVTIIYVFYQSAEHKINMEEALKVASSMDHIIVVGGGSERNFKQLFKNIMLLACNYPCPDESEE